MVVLELEHHQRQLFFRWILLTLHYGHVHAGLGLVIVHHAKQNLIRVIPVRCEKEVELVAIEISYFAFVFLFLTAAVFNFNGSAISTLFSSKENHELNPAFQRILLADDVTG